MVPELRKEEILKSIKKRDISYIKDLAAELNISLSTVRRDVAALEQEGSVIVMRGGAVKYKAEDFDEPVVKKKLIHSEEKEIIARKAAALVEDGDCVYGGFRHYHGGDAQISPGKTYHHCLQQHGTAGQSAN